MDKQRDAGLDRKEPGGQNGVFFTEPEFHSGRCLSLPLDKIWIVVVADNCFTLRRHFRLSSSRSQDVYLDLISLDV
jgi:hypothetical protein